MRTYELAAVFRHEADLYQKGLETVRRDIARFGGSIQKEEDLGERVLAYPLKKETSARYLVFHVDLDPAKVDDLDKQLKLDPNLLKFMLIKPEED